MTPERIKQAFSDYLEQLTRGGRLLINRVDLHEKTFESGYKQGAEDMRYSLSGRFKEMADEIKELKAKK